MKNTAQGFSLIEILVVVALVSLFVFPLLFNAVQVGQIQSLRSAAAVLSDDLSAAKVASRDARDQKAWGVVSIDDTHYQVVSGAKNNFETSQARTLDKGLSFVQPFTVWFQIGTGGVQNNERIEIMNQRGNVFEITVNKTGVVQIKQL